MSAMTRKLESINLRAVREIGQLIYDDSRANCPRRSSRLYRSAWKKLIPGGFSFGYRAPYFGVVENGSQARNEFIKGHQRRSYLRRVKGRSRRLRVRASVVNPYRRRVPAREGKHFVRNAYARHLPKLAPLIAQRIVEAFPDMR